MPDILTYFQNAADRPDASAQAEEIHAATLKQFRAGR